MTYVPNPIDTTSVTLPASIAELLERLAENTHEVWASRRMAEGWAYGPQRDDARKKNPCLIPYRELPESEKQYDRATAGEVLKAIYALGYRLERP